MYTAMFAGIAKYIYRFDVTLTLLSQFIDMVQLISHHSCLLFD